MKVLWITSGLPSLVVDKFEVKPPKSSGWVDSLLIQLNEDNGIFFGLLCPVENGVFQKIEYNGIYFYTIPTMRGENLKIMSKALIGNYLQVINDFNPNLIHIHGTERNFGLLKKEIGNKTPIVISIQGFIFSCLPFLIQSICNINISKYRSLKNLLFYGGVNGYLKSWRNYENIEKEILNINKYFIGRTLWDQSQLHAVNPNAIYFQGEELLRDDFYKTNWEINKCNRETIFFSSAAYSLKGFHILLKAILILRIKYPNIMVNVPLANVKNKLTFRDRLFGEDYALYLGYLIRKHKLENNVNFFSRLNSSEMAKQFQCNHIYVSASFIENSQNSLCEAMAVGIPNVCSFVGGTGSIVKDEESTLMFPSGDYNLLALQIERIFTDDQLAIKLSRNAKNIAKVRHNLAFVSQQYINIYETIISFHTRAEDYY